MKYKYNVGEKIQFRNYSCWLYIEGHPKKCEVFNALTTGTIFERHSYVMNEEKKDEVFYMVQIDGESFTAHVDGKEVIGVVKDVH